MKRTISILAFILLGLLGLGTAIALWDQAFPTAVLDLRISRTEAEAQMQQWLQAQGFPLVGYHHAILFGETSETKNYLELEKGLADLNRLVKEGVNIWYWYGRWFKPEQEEEFSVSLDPQGHLVLYLHTIPEARAVPSLTKKEAYALAEKFLQTHVHHHPFYQLHFVEESTEQKPHRTNHTFTWERKDLRVKEAPYRLEVTVEGNRVGTYSEELKIPEAWTRDFSRKRELNNLCETIAEYGLWILLAGGVILFIVYIYQQQLDWTHALPWGWMVLFGIATLASAFNNIPSIIAEYQTTSNWGSYVMEQISSTLREGLYTVGGIWLLVVVVDPLYRQNLPQHLPFRLGLGIRALQYRETLRALGLGIVFACMSLGYVCLFYVISKHHGAWAPIEVDYSKTLSGWWLWMEPLQIGLSAAFTEEMLFRALAILLYTKIFRFRWLAIILSATTWAFLHSNYPQMPGYIRGIELTIEGILWGVLMTRFGILTTLTAHYLIDCWLESFVILHTPNWSDRIGAIVVSTWPIVLGLWGWWKYARRKICIETPPPSVQHLTKYVAPRWWQPTSKKWDVTTIPTPSLRQVLLILVMILLGDVFFHKIPFPQKGMMQLGQPKWSQSQINQEADRVLQQHHQDPQSFHRITTLVSSSTESKYLLEYGTLSQMANLFRNEWPDLRWRVRYFRFGEKEEFRFQFNPMGHLFTWNHIVPREGKGASLEKNKAFTQAQRYLQEKQGVDLTGEILTQENMEQQENRRDYTFTFERKTWGWGDSKLRTTISMQGNEPMRFDRYVHVPEAWEREQSAMGWKDALLKQISSWLNTGKIVLTLLLFVIMIRENILPWKTGFLMALIPSGISIINELNCLPWFFTDYTTHQPVSYYIVQKLGNFVFHQIILEYLWNALGASVVLGLLHWAFGWKWDPRTWWPSSTEARRHQWFSALVLSLFGIVIWQAEGLLISYVCGWLFPDRVAFFQYPNVNSVFPWLASFLNALSDGYEGVLRVATKVAIAVIFYRRFPKTIWILLFAAPLYFALSGKTWAEFGYLAAIGELTWLINLILIWRVWRFHSLAIFMAATLSPLLTSIQVFLLKGGPYYQWQAIPILLIFLLITLPAFLPLSSRHAS